SNHTIRKLTPVGTNWVSTTIAGLAGNIGSADGTNSSARFYNPNGIAVDSAGRLYVADANNQIIRKLTPAGTNWVVTTIAGTAHTYGHADGTNETASFFYPEGIAADAAGNLFVADSSNHAIRKITPVGTDWVVTTIAGASGNSGHADGTNNAATFNSPYGITVDKNGILFVADSYNDTIRKITPVGTNWVTATVAGKVGVADGIDGTGTNATFNFPTSLAADTNGNIFVADTQNYLIRQLTPSGTNYVVTTPAGRLRVNGSTDGTNNNALFYTPHGVTVDKAGNLIVADSQNSEIRKITLFGTNWVTSTLAGFAKNIGDNDGANSAARFNTPMGVVADTNGNLYVSDQNSYVIRKLAPVGTNWVVTTIAGQPNVSGFQDGTNTAATFYYPGFLTLDSSGNLFVAETGNSTIRKMTPVGTNWVVTTIAGSAGSPGTADGTNSVARFYFPTGIAADANGNLYVSDQHNSTIRKLTPVGTNWVVTTIAGKVNVFSNVDATGTNATFNYPAGLAVDNAGNLFVADSNGPTIRKITPVGTNWVVTTVAGLADGFGWTDGTNNNARFYFPLSLSVDNTGTLFVADTSDNTLRKIAPSGTDWIVTTVGGVPQQQGSADGTGSAALFNYPQGVTVDKNGIMYVTDSFNATVRKGVAETVIVLGTPILLGAGQVQIPFVLANGFASTFKLLQAAQVGGPYTTNAAAVLNISVPGVAYKFTVTTNAAAAFYRVQTP
ncbi:MAG: repeat containing protein, partial [Pedosphaera sp.]|nr:repeat containing protein [Pedosphaera sp.]